MSNTSQILPQETLPEVKAPWLKSYDEEVPAHLNYSAKTMEEALEDTARRHGDLIAYDYMGSHCTYRELVEKVHQCARALKAMGIREGDRVTICMPNCPQTLIMFYAVNLVGAVSNMVHPLSAESEIAFYLRDSASVAAITLDQFYPKFARIRRVVDLPNLIVTSAADELSAPVRAGY